MLNLVLKSKEAKMSFRIASNNPVEEKEWNVKYKALRGHTPPRLDVIKNNGQSLKNNAVMNVKT